MVRLLAWGLILFSLLAGARNVASAQTSYPMLMATSPVAVQVGKTSEVSVLSRHSMFGAYRVLVTGEGVSAEVVHPEIEKDEQGKPVEKKLEELKLRFSVSEDAKPGVRDFRIATPQGASTLGQLVVTAEAVVVEQRNNNNTMETAQGIEVPATVCGSIEKDEDVDLFRFRAAAGSRLVFHVRSMRLQNRIHDLQRHVDPILTLRDQNGSTLAASDNYFFGDPAFSYRFQRDGEYLLEIRDLRYHGNKYWQYSIEISDRPLVTCAFPLAVQPGTASKVEPIGFELAASATAELKLPADRPNGFAELPLQLAAGASNPVPLVISDLPLTLESDAENDQPASGQEVSLPAGINGRIEKAQDVDHYRFAAGKDEKYSFEVIARRRQSALDPHLRVLDAEGKQLALADDMTIGIRSSADSRIENWAAPADGTYVVEVRDLHLRGGRDYPYLLRATRSEPHFNLFADTDKTQLTPGGCGVVFVRVERKNGFAGEVQLSVEGLPEGVTATCGRILTEEMAAKKGQADGCIVLQAQPDADLAMTDIVIRGTGQHQEGEGEEQSLTATARIYQEIYQPGGGRGHWPSSTHAVSVGAPGDIRSVKLSAGEVTLQPGESQKIDVTIERAEGFDKNVTLDVVYQHLNRVYGNPLPRGVKLDKAKSKTLLSGKTATGHITLTADKDAPRVDKQQVAVMAHVSLNFVMKATYASRPVVVSVGKGE